MKRKSQITEIMENSIHLINEQYNQPMHLNIIAKQNFMSPATYSRYFFELTQCSFTNYINKLRVNHAKKDLICTDHSLTQIALQHGFSNSSVFSKIFRNYTELSPSDFRKKYKINLENESPQNITTELKISDFHGFHMEKAWLYALNAGDMRLLSRTDLQYQILEIAKELSMKYVRIWNLFSRELLPAGTSDLTRLDFNHLDSIFDFLVYHDLKPWINLTKQSDVVIKDIISAPSEPDAYGTIMPPDTAFSFYENLFRHWIIRYGSNHVSQWIFECWYNDIDDGPKAKENFIQTVAVISSILKKHLPQARLGILSNSILSMKKEISELLDYWPNNLNPDFVSVFCFPYIKEKDSPQKMRERQFTRKCFQVTQNLLQQYHMEELPIYISQWNITVSPRNAINDSCIAACMLLSNIEETLTEKCPILYCYASDICTTQMDTLPTIFGGIGLVTKDFLKKPVYYALSFFSKLSEYCLSHGPGYIITTDRTGRYDILLFNTCMIPEFYYDQREYEITTNMVLSELCSGNTQTFHIHMKSSSDYPVYRQETTRLIPGQSDLLGQLKKFGEAAELTFDEIQYLQHIVRPEMSVKKLAIDDSAIDITQTLKPYEICYISLCPIA